MQEIKAVEEEENFLLDMKILVVSRFYDFP